MADDLPRHTPRDTRHDYDIAICRKLDRMNYSLKTIATGVVIITFQLAVIVGVLVGMAFS